MRCLTFHLAPLAGRSPPSTARRGRRHRLVAGFPNREDEAPDQLPDELHALDHSNASLPTSE
jgi:hypothetical protein